MAVREAFSIEEKMNNSSVDAYRELLEKRRGSIAVKRVFDFTAALLMLVLLSPAIGIISLFITLDSPGGVMFLQERVTKNGRIFKIYKFRTMVKNAQSMGTQVTVNHDPRITRAGHFLRKYRLDELPQLINIIKGDMSFVGARPEVERYVKRYTDEMLATLLLPAGVTSLASIYYKDEEKLLSETKNVDETYVNAVLPEKMKYNLEYIRKFNFFYDIKLMFMTFFAVCGIFTPNKKENEVSENV